MTNVFETLTAGNMKAAGAAAGASKSDLYMVPIDHIRVLEGFNVRTRNADLAAHIAWIGESILANGYDRTKPLAGYVAREGDDNFIYITDGHNRLEGVAYANERGAELKLLPVLMKPAGTQIEDLTVALVTSNSGKPLTPIEKAAVCKRLIGYGMDEDTIAKRLGFTKNYIAELLALIAAPRAVRKLVESGEVSAANARTAMRQHGDKAAEVLAAGVEQAKSEGRAKVTNRVLKPRISLVDRGVAWIKDEGAWAVLPNRKMAELLAHLTDRKSVV